MGDLEQSGINLIYDVNLFIFEEINNSNSIQLLQIYGDPNDKTKIVLTIHFVDNNHFSVIYEYKRFVNNNSSYNYNNLTYMKSYINLTTENKINNKESLFNTNLLYTNDNRRIKYKHIIHYLKFGDSEEIGKYPQYIYDITPIKRGKNAKKQFLKICKGYSIDNKTNRLMKTIIYKNY